MGSQTVGHDWATFTQSLSTINLGPTSNPVHAIYICWDFLNFCFIIMVKCKYVYLLFIYTYAIWTARRSNQSILKKISPGCSLEGMMLKLKLQYFGHLMRRVDSLEKTDAGRDWGTGGEGDDRGWDGWMASPTRWTWVWVNSGSWWWTGRPGALQFIGSQRVGHDWATELNWCYFLWLVSSHMQLCGL